METTKVLRHLFTFETPLGPSATPVFFQKKENKSSFRHLFDRENFLSKEILERHPSTILGRRGSGKTAYLFHLSFNGGYKIVVPIESSNVFSDVAEGVNKRVGGAESARGALVENTSKIWESILFTTIICEVFQAYSNHSDFKDSKSINKIKEFLRNSGLVNIKLYQRVFRTITKSFEAYAKLNYNIGDGDSLPKFSDWLEGVFKEEIGFSEAWEATCKILNDDKSRCVILIDSLEQFPVNRFDMRDALAGLLHFVGEVDRNILPVKISLCLPAELHEELASISENTEKDFERVIVLHWDAPELFQMCGRRCNILLDFLSYPRTAKIDKMPDQPSNAEIWSFWMQLFPKEIENRNGRNENTFFYITRHTQLLPRHLLGILNKIIMLSLKNNDNRLDKVSNEEIIEGVKLGEGTICDGIINGFKQKYPIARDVCKLIVPNLPTLIEFSELTVINKERGKGMIKDTFDLLEMFIRMGILGRVDKTTSKYVECKFDYTYNGQMPFSTDDIFGLHPAFSGHFRRIMREQIDFTRVLPIFPKEDFTGQRFGVGRLDF